MAPRELHQSALPEGTPHLDAEQALRDADERTRRALAATNTALWEIDLARSEVIWSANLDALVKRPVERLDMEQGLRWIHPADVDRVREAWTAVVTDRCAYSVEYRIVWPDGTVRWLLSAGRVVEGERGGPARLIGSTTDVTERHSIEAQLRQSQKMDAIGRMAGGIAHDFNNLLTVIQGYGQLLAEKALDPTQTSEIREVLQATERASVLTRHLLSFSQQQVVDPVALDLNAVVRDLMGLMRRLIGTHIELVVTVADRPRTVRGDKGQLGQVLMNLVMNARDAMPGGGRLTVEIDHVEMDTAGVIDGIGVMVGRYARLRVSDTGIGMTEETRSRIFEPFFTTRDRGKATGLGLATVYGIVAQSGGHIRVHSEVDAGSTFEVWLPMTEQPPVASGRARASNGIAGDRVVLVIEDQDAVRSLVRRILEREGFGVLEAAESSRAERLFDEHQAEIALIVADVGIPGEKGTDLYRRLVTKKPELRVIYISGQIEETALGEDTEHRYERFLAKPFSAAGLIGVVQDALRE